jgi:ribokinase
MTNRTDMGSPDALVLTHALEKLRARDGLTHSRLENSRAVESGSLLGLAAVRRYAAVHDVELSEAALDVIKECVRDNLQGSQRIVADAVLGLGIFSATYLKHGIPERTVSALSSDLLGRRRDNLLRNWRPLHEALTLSPIDPPSDRALRGTIEPNVLRELARQLIRREMYSIGSKSVVMPAANENSSEPRESTRGRIIVVGGAVMDATFRTKVLPLVQTSTEALGFSLAPGGKGLQQAVAAARLGLDVALVAAVADDRFGHEIVNYLQDEHVDTSLLKLVDEAHTPFTGVIEFELGNSLAINWPNHMEVRLDIRDIDRLQQQFVGCDAVLLTFEMPRESLQYTLALLHQLLDPRPIVLVTPGQPYDTAISGQALSQIDYLVAQPWELGRYAPADGRAFDLDVAARRLLAYGVETLCVPTPAGCNI